MSSTANQQPIELAERRAARDERAQSPQGQAKSGQEQAKSRQQPAQSGQQPAQSGKQPSQSRQLTAAQQRAYRQLAIAALGLDLPTLTQQLRGRRLEQTSELRLLPQILPQPDRAA